MKMKEAAIMLKEIALADAYGSGFEFCSRAKIAEHNSLKYYVEHELHGFKAKYTDDTQMTLAVVEFLLSGDSWVNENIAEAFLRVYARDKRKGYSKGFQVILSSAKSGKELVQMLKTDSTRNGAAMRSVPIGYIAGVKKLIEFAKVQASVTHNTPDAIRSSCAVALAAHFGIYKQGKVKDIPKFLEFHGYGGWDYKWNNSVSVDSYETVSAALTILLANENLASLLANAVELGGDVDTVAAISIGLGSCFEELRNNIPSELYDQLDEHTYGIRYLDKLEKGIISKIKNNSG